mmetsp:Transcript_19447/g.55737  ORF Transcript_19447/g.55737 Transcript_19447/m.55737 type:complete len:108 (+) Transcript_19447:465-788(+)
MEVRVRAGRDRRIDLAAGRVHRAAGKRKQAIRCFRHAVKMLQRSQGFASLETRAAAHECAEVEAAVGVEDLDQVSKEDWELEGSRELGERKPGHFMDDVPRSLECAR